MTDLSVDATYLAGLTPKEIVAAVETMRSTFQTGENVEERLNEALNELTKVGDDRAKEILGLLVHSSRPLTRVIGACNLWDLLKDGVQEDDETWNLFITLANVLLQDSSLNVIQNLVATLKGMFKFEGTGMNNSQRPMIDRLSLKQVIQVTAIIETAAARSTLLEQELKLQ